MITSVQSHFVSHVLAFFTASDGIVKTCSLLINTYIKDSSQHKYLFDAMDTTPCVKCKADWALKWISDQHSTFGECSFSSVEFSLISPRLSLSSCKAD
ncbi:hypothetical protein EDD22DRAFT_784676 [Suillus occidentalis]|nr:hypothetical protein EDD22DRAFT_784676 [Suillus occidentalis]